MYAYNARSALRELVLPTLKYFEEAGIPASEEAQIMLLAIGYQESGWWARKQIGGGPARGLWQFEKWGGVYGVMHHAMTEGLARQLCDDQFVRFDIDTIHAQLAENDMLACGFARLLLFTDRQPLRAESAEGWSTYLRTWRPGRPRRETWAVGHFQATMAVQAQRERGLVFVQHNP